MNLTKHANTRSQQRAIPPMFVDLLLDHGRWEKAGPGASKVFFDKAARRRVKAFAGPYYAKLGGLNYFAVVTDDDVVVTVGHLTERVRRH